MRILDPTDRRPLTIDLTAAVGGLSDRLVVRRSFGDQRWDALQGQGRECSHGIRLLGDRARAALGGSHGGNRCQNHYRRARITTFTRAACLAMASGCVSMRSVRKAKDRESSSSLRREATGGTSVGKGRLTTSRDGPTTAVCCTFVSDRGGTNNVWAVRFDPRGGKPLGEPFPVTRFDGPGEMIESVTAAEFGVGRRRLFLPVVTPTGGIWMLEGVER